MLDIINRFGHGYVAVPVLVAIARHGLFESTAPFNPVARMAGQSTGRLNTGHFHVALRLLESLGILERTAEGFLQPRPDISIWRNIPERILEPDRRSIEHTLRDGVEPVWLIWANEFSSKGWHCGSASDSDRAGMEAGLVRDFLDGMALVPVLLYLSSNLSSPDGAEWTTAIHERVRPIIVEWFQRRGWGNAHSLTETGRFLLRRAMNLGSVASYEPMLRAMPELLFGDASPVFARDASGAEKHVDRQLNVISSGFQHHRYFEDVEELILSIFNQLPIESQPRFVADMGCGDGTFLQKIYEIIRDRSERGKWLSKHPVTMVGVDFNEASLDETRRTLEEAGIPHFTLWGDIGDPERLLADLKREVGGAADDVLHVRSFLDHNRPFLPPRNKSRVQQMDGCDLGDLLAVDDAGGLIPAGEAFQSLVEHFERWRTAVNRHGLVVLEVHALSASEVRQHLDTTESLHFDAYHGFSGQHLVEARVFFMAAAEAGLFPRKSFFQRYPRSLPISRITLSLLEPRPYSIRVAVPGDLESLLEIEKACWPETMRTGREEIRARLEAREAETWVVILDGRVAGVLYSQRIEDGKSLATARVDELSRLRSRHGRTIQLLGMNVLPEAQTLGLGDQLLDFALHDFSLRSDADRVVGVTRCKEFAGQSNLTIGDYIFARDQGGRPLDPILKFHVHHGAKILGLVPEFRPADLENRGHGVLIEYRLREDVEPGGPDAAETSGQAGSTDASGLIRRAIRRVVGEKRMAAYHPSIPLMELGVDSLGLLELRTLLSREFGTELGPVFFFNHPTPDAIARYFEAKGTVTSTAGLEKEAEARKVTAFSSAAASASGPVAGVARQDDLDDVAIVGMACRFPGGVHDPETFWGLLRGRRDGVGPIPPERWDIEKYYSPDRTLPGKMICRRGGFIEGVDAFDADFFRISPREAKLMDPQQRLLLRTAWEALEDANINPHRLSGSATGVFLGVFSHDYESNLLQSGSALDLDAYFATGNSASVAAGRISYFLGLQGPALSVDTACSSSLVALHLACQSLKRDECSLALAAGVNLILNPDLSITFSRAGMLSPEGKCRAFDAAADGYVRSEGCAVVVLKRLSRARADGDTILAVLRGSAINQDGASNGLTAPNGAAQEAVLRSALTAARVEPWEVSHVEAHGTGTSLGDPVEFQALTSVYGKGRARTNPLLLTSVKSNIGHTEAAAGLAGVIKVVLSMQHKWIPGNLHFEKPNPHLNLDLLPAIVPAEGHRWEPQAGRGLLAGVSSFGFSGTNAHVIIGEGERAADENRRHQNPRLNPGILTISSRTSGGLQALVQKYRQRIAEVSEEEIPGLACSSNVARAHFEHRLALPAGSRVELLRAVDDWLGTAAMKVSLPRKSRDRMAFLFTGQGAQFARMGERYFDSSPVFRSALEECDAVLRECSGVRLLDLLYGGNGDGGELDQTRFTQPALFAFEYAMARLWISCGVRPDFVLGHSLGEYVAACISGLFTLEDALRLVALRAELMQSLPPGGVMLAVRTSRARIERVLAGNRGMVSVAAWNGPESAVLSGPVGELERITAEFEREQIAVMRLPVSHAFHSGLMRPMVERFRAAVDSVKWGQLRIPLISNLNGLPAGEEIRTSDYWCRHILEPVQFEAGMRKLAEERIGLFLEVGPKPVLIGMARSFLDVEGAVFLSSLRAGDSGTNPMTGALVELYQRGWEIDWEAVHLGGEAVRIPLPKYVFTEERHWVDAPVDRPAESSSGANVEEGAVHSLLGRRLNSPLRQIQYEHSLSTSRLPVLLDHVVGGRVLLPFAAVLEMAMAAGSRLNESGVLTLSDVAMSRALDLSGNSLATTQFILSPEEGGWEFELHSAAGRDDAWNRYATGKIGFAQNSVGVRSELSVVRQGSGSVGVDRFYAGCLERGITYGKLFQVLTELGSSRAMAVGHVQSRDGQPGLALLDGALQVGFATLPDELAGRSYLPVRLDKFELLGVIENSIWSVATLREVAGGGAVVLDFDWFDDRGKPVARLEGFRMVPADSGRIGADYLYEIEWCEKAFVALEKTGANAGVEAARRFRLEESEERNLELLESEATRAARAALSELGIDHQSMESVAGWIERTGIPSRQARYVERLVEIARHESRHDPSVAGASIELDLLRHCSRDVAAVVTGRKSAVEVLFSAENSSLLRRFYAESSALLAMNRRLAEFVASHIKGRSPGRRIRVLEIGAGTGATTAQVLPLFDADTTDYCFSDLSAGFFGPAREKFAASSFLRFEKFDVESSQDSEAFSGRFDLVLAANVLHATRDLTQVLRNIQRVLVPGGTVLLLEGVGRRGWIDLVFGMTEGWWRFAGGDGRLNHPLLDADSWERMLDAAGFRSARSMRSDSEPRAIFPQAILLAEKPLESRRWLLVGGRENGVLLAQSLKRSGDDVVDIQDWKSGGGSSIPGLKKDFDGVVYLGALEAVNSANAEDLTLEALQFVQALLADLTAVPGAVWILTRGAAPIETRMDRLGNAPLWGLGKVVELEHPELNLRRIDLDPAVDAIDFDAVVELLRNRADGDHEMAIRRGRNLVPRLARFQLPEGENLAWKVAESGVIDDMQVVDSGRPAPGPGMIEIEVRASGLNFLDVLDALHVLPFHRPEGLGMECAGIVARVGAGVTGVEVGKRVMALAPGSLKQYVRVKSELAVGIPERLTFQEAATLPVNHLTAILALKSVARLARGERVLIHAAATGTGLAATRLALSWGAEVFATCSESKRDLLLGMGVKHVFDSRSEDFAETIRERTRGEGVDVVLNSLTGSMIARSLELLRGGGRFIELGKSDIWDSERVAAVNPSASYCAVDLYELAARDPSQVGVLFKTLLEELAAGRCVVPPRREFCWQEVRNGFKTMERAKHVGKLVFRHPLASFGLHSEATYLITGGLGGLGLELARWMVEQGARNLVLTARNSAGPSAVETLKALESAGARIVVRAVDVGDLAAMRNLLDQISRDMPPLRGVVHAAGVLDDGVLLRQNRGKFSRVLHPKITGAWNLHWLTREHSLDFFVLFSSTASLLGASGQSNHAAANAFMDALAAARRFEGLPAQSIQWGAWAGAGAALETRAGGNLEQKGILRMDPAVALGLFGRFLGSHRSLAGVARIDWEQVFLTRAAGSYLASFREQSRGRTVSGGSPKPQLARLPLMERRGALISLVLGHVSKVLALRREIDPDEGFFQLGLDSLTSVELRNKLQLDLDCNLPATVAFDHPNARALAGFLARELGWEEAPTPAGPVEPESSTREMQLDELSDAELAELLSRQLGPSE